MTERRDAELTAMIQGVGRYRHVANEEVMEAIRAAAFKPGWLRRQLKLASDALKNAPHWMRIGDGGSGG